MNTIKMKTTGISNLYASNIKFLFLIYKIHNENNPPDGKVTIHKIHLF